MVNCSIEQPATDTSWHCHLIKGEILTRLKGREWVCSFNVHSKPGLSRDILSGSSKPKHVSTQNSLTKRTSSIESGFNFGFSNVTTSEAIKLCRIASNIEIMYPPGNIVQNAVQRYIFRSQLDFIITARFRIRTSCATQQSNGESYQQHLFQDQR